MGAARVWSERLLLRSFTLRNAAQRHQTPALRSLFASTQHPAASKLVHGSFIRSSRSAPPRRSLFLQPFRSLRLNSSKPRTTQNPDPTPHLGSPNPTPSLSQRLRKLSREYGWSALGVYLALTALDFPFCFLAVRMLGTDRIGHYEDVVIEAFWKVVRIPFPNLGKHPETEEVGVIDEDTVQATAREGQLGWSGEVNQAEAKNRGAEASIWTQLALAYAIHKAFIFVRVPLTAAVTPKVVKTLRGWGWDIGKRKPKTK